jgi:glycosyltransferase involved in cell wall biosynthesis
MRIGIDASNLRAGGTVTHLVELLRAADPRQHGIDEVIVWAGSAVLKKIGERPWLRKETHPLLEQAANPFLDRRHLQRTYWQRFRLRKQAKASKCDLLFVPGGMDNSGFHPMVAMSRNMLLFEFDEARRYGFSPALLRLWLLRWLQIRTFRRAAGVILLTPHAHDLISQAIGTQLPRVAIIPHGVSERFLCPPRPQRSIEEYSTQRPFRILYVSTIDLYKHQWHVVDAVARLRLSGLPVAIDLVGPANGSALNRLTQTIEALRASDFVCYRGAVLYDELHEFYRQADLKVFASSCENMPNILIEAMAAGLPIACSNREPMPGILGAAGVYFNPEKPVEIAAAIAALIASPALRSSNAELGFARAQEYSWRKCAAATFAFLSECALQCRGTP